MFKCRKPKFFSIWTCFFAFIFVVYWFEYNLLGNLNFLLFKDAGDDEVVIVWWTPFFTGERTIQCGEVSCFVSDDRRLWADQSSAFLFYGTNFEKSDLPLPRKKTVWALLHEESPRNSPLLNHESVLSLFNFSSTFSRHSDMPLTFQYLPSLESLTKLEFYKTFDQKSKSRLAPVIYIQSDCVTPNNRDSYVAELMKYIEVDSYGVCLNNKALPERLNDPVDSMMSPDLLHIIGNYKFSISIENALCEDYITEKLWRPLIVGSIPLYIGSPTIKDWLPNNFSAIMANDFVSPKSLANYLHYLSNNPSEYNKYLQHKLRSEIDNAFLIKKYEKYRAYVKSDTFVEEFECFVCKKLHSKDQGKVTKKHFNCFEPVSIVNHKYNSSNWWHNDYFVSKCEADLLRSFIDKDIPFRQMKFNC